MTNFLLPDDTHIGYAHLQISDLKRSLHFYENLVGLKRASGLAGTAVLSASGKSPYHVLLTEHPGARPKPPRSTGLYHIAIRYPSRRELARAVQRMYQGGIAFQGFSDHLVSEAAYLADPDGNGVELYVDRPRSQWITRDNQIQMATRSLDLDSLFRELKDNDPKSDGVDPKIDIGHIHLHVSNLRKAETFYHTLLGFDVTQRAYPGALFLSAGGYHHHIGVNIWSGQGAPPPPSDAVGLLSFGVHITGGETMELLKKRFVENGVESKAMHDDLIGCDVLRVNDPDGMAIEFLVTENT